RGGPRAGPAAGTSTAAAPAPVAWPRGYDGDERTMSLTLWAAPASDTAMSVRSTTLPTRTAPEERTARGSGGHRVTTTVMAPTTTSTAVTLKPTSATRTIGR